jgi:hypothetical protein
VCRKDEKCLQNFCLKRNGKKLLGRSRHRWFNNIKMHLKETGWKGVDWSHVAVDRDQFQAVMNMLMNL